MPEPVGASAAATQHAVPPISLRRRITDHVMTGVAVLTVNVLVVLSVAEPKLVSVTGTL